MLVVGSNAQPRKVCSPLDPEIAPNRDIESRSNLTIVAGVVSVEKKPYCFVLSAVAVWISFSLELQETESRRVGFEDEKSNFTTLQGKSTVPK
jgi:hypothetical protein